MRSGQKSQCFRWQAVVSFAVILLAARGRTYGQEFQPGCTLPFARIAERRPIDDNCGVDGTNAPHLVSLQDRLKNNYCASGTPVPTTQATFVQLQGSAGRRGVPFGSPGRLPSDRAILKSLYMENGKQLGEGTLVRFAGFLLSAHYSNVASGEAVNCRLRGADNNDISISLGQAPDDDLCNSIRVEISPHFRPSAWNQLVTMNLRNNPVRVTGPLFFDASHRPCSDGMRAHPERISLWEIHPIYALDVCRNTTLQSCSAGDESSWTPLDQWHTANSQPVKLIVLAKFAAVAPATEANLQVALRDANNLPSPAGKDMPIIVEAISSSGTVLERRELLVQRGHPSADFSLSITREGIVQIRAKNRELLDGSTFIMVTSGQKSKPQASHTNGRFLTAQYTIDYGIHAIPRFSLPKNAALWQSPVRAQLVYGARTYLADGKDGATLQGWLHQPAEQDIQLFLSTDLGEIGPTDPERPGPPALVIPKGGMKGSVVLRSTTVGLAHVRFMGSPQGADVEDPKTLEVRFGAPITRAELDASPPMISLMESSSLVVALTDDNHHKLSTETERRVRFLLRPQASQAGRGEFDYDQLVIPAGRPDASRTFFPYWPGTVTVLVSVDNLPDATAPLQVFWPLWHLIFTSVGGLIGAMFAYWARKDSHWWQIPMGAITGFILYWAVVFVFRTKISHPSVLNPLSAFGFAAVGGWLGTEVFSLVLKSVGLK